MYLIHPDQGHPYSITASHKKQHTAFLFQKRWPQNKDLSTISLLQAPPACHNHCKVSTTHITYTPPKAPTENHEHWTADKKLSKPINTLCSGFEPTNEQKMSAEFLCWVFGSNCIMTELVSLSDLPCCPACLIC